MSVPRAEAFSGERLPRPVLAGVAHYELTNIHPFADGNGRLARLFAVAILFREGYVSRRLFSAERYYAMDKEAYYEALRSVRRNTNNMEQWLLYFTDGLAQEFERVADRVRELNGLSQQLARTIQLSRNQEQAVAALTTGGRSEISRADYEELVGVRRTQASTDLAGLVKARILKAVGSGPNTRYRLAISIKTNGGRKRGPTPSWTDQRIEAELREFIGERRDWPSPSEFRTGGKMALYQAASRRGGIAHWSALLGLEAP